MDFFGRSGLGVFRTFGVPRTFGVRTFGVQPRTSKNPERPKTPNVQNLKLTPNVQNPECPKPPTPNPECPNPECPQPRMSVRDLDLDAIILLGQLCPNFVLFCESVKLQTIFPIPVRYRSKPCLLSLQGSRCKEKRKLGGAL